MEFVEECELVREFHVERGVGLVAARRDVKIVELDRPVGDLEGGADVAGVALVAKIAAARRVQRQARGDGDPVIAFLPVDENMLITGLPKGGEREFAVAALGIIWADY